MNRRRILSIVALTGILAGTSQGAQFQTLEGNFIVKAQSREVAQEVGEHAEYYRREKAIEWLGGEMPTWPEPCAIEVRLTYGGAGGATSFAFDQGRILSQQMVVEGSLERILDSVLPHEITHTVFAHKFRRPLPRWADEGGAVLSEDYQELRRHDLLVRQLINEQRKIPLSRLFNLTEYPRDVMALYAQGFSVANFLVSRGSRILFLDFVDYGQRYGWDTAAQQFYGFRSVNQLENEWIEWLRAGRGTGADGPRTLARTATPPPRRRVAANGLASSPGARNPGIANHRNQVASMSSPGMVVRGQMPDELPGEIQAPSAQAYQASILGVSDADPRRGTISSSAMPEMPPLPFSHANADGRSRAQVARHEPIGQDPFATKPLAVPRAQPLAVTPQESNFDETQNGPGGNFPARLIPIAVGRTRRSHDGANARPSPATNAFSIPSE